MAAHRRDQSEDRNEENRRQQRPTSTSCTARPGRRSRTAESRSRAAALVAINYSYLRASCPLLPQNGRLARHHVLRGAADQMRSLKCENDFLQWRLTASWAAQERRNARLQGQEPVEEPDPRGGREQRDISSLLETLLRNEDPSPLFQDTGGGEGDGLQIIDVRGGCQWPVTSTQQAQNRRPSPERDDDPARPRIVRAEVGGGEISGSHQEDVGMEIKVVWGGTTQSPVPVVSHPRPRRSDSPPLPRRTPLKRPRSWMATPIGRKIQLGSSTLQQVRTIPINHTSRVPATINIPTHSLGVPGGSDMYPMDLSKRSPPPLIPIEEWPACLSPSRSQDNFERPPTHGIAQILKAAHTIEKARMAAQDAMMNNVEMLVNAHANRENDKDIGVETIPTTRNGLWSPANDVMWGDSPPLVIDLEATPITDPEPTRPLIMTSTSRRGTSPSQSCPASRKVGRGSGRQLC